MRTKQKPSPRVVEAVEPEPAPLRSFEQYELLWETCRDALSVTYAARRSGVEGMLSVRIFNEQARAEIQVHQIRDSAKKAAEVTHANAITVYETGVAEDGAPYVVTEFVEGHTLKDLLSTKKRLDLGSLLRILLQVCDALKETHGRRLIHGNLSPDKIVSLGADYEFDAIKVIDFGMPPDPAQHGFYVSPDQWLDKGKIDERSDIYSLGCIMYECIVGNPPFVGHRRSETGLNQLHELASQYPPDSAERQALRLLDSIVVKCLQTNRWQRFANVGELSDALRLVDECLTKGSRKHLPPKAEKLLLFRFLDIFDKKIMACAFAYLLVALCSVKFVAELQLQKYIDSAQLASMNGDLPLAQANWNAALHQAQWAGKPPGLIADIHWELGNVFRRQASEVRASNRVEAADPLEHDAIEQYQSAYRYFSRGAAMKSCALMLLHSQSVAWASMSDKQWREARDAELKRSVFDAFGSGDDQKCVELGQTYARTIGMQIDVRRTVSKALFRLAERSKPKDALPFYARAYYFYGTIFGSEDLQQGFDAALAKLKLAPSADTAGWAMQRFFAQGDAEAVCAINRDCDTRSLCDDFLLLSNAAYQRLPVKSPRLVQRVEVLERALALQNEIDGEHNPKLWPQLMELAQCYLANEQTDKAAETYKRAFLYRPVSADWCEQTEILPYIDLLDHSGKTAQCIQLLQERIAPHGVWNVKNPLTVRLVQLYAKCKMQKNIENIAKQLEYTTFEPTRSDTVPQRVEDDDPFAASSK